VTEHLNSGLGLMLHKKKKHTHLYIYCITERKHILRISSVLRVKLLVLLMMFPDGNVMLTSQVNTVLCKVRVILGTIKVEFFVSVLVVNKT